MINSKILKVGLSTTFMLLACNNTYGFNPEEIGLCDPDDCVIERYTENEPNPHKLFHTIRNPRLKRAKLT
jgi:hypothetical protein